MVNKSFDYDIRLTINNLLNGEMNCIFLYFNKDDEKHLKHAIDKYLRVLGYTFFEGRYDPVRSGRSSNDRPYIYVYTSKEVLDHLDSIRYKLIKKQYNVLYLCIGSWELLQKIPADIRTFFSCVIIQEPTTIEEWASIYAHLSNDQQRVLDKIIYSQRILVSEGPIVNSLKKLGVLIDDLQLDELLREFVRRNYIPDQMPSISTNNTSKSVLKLLNLLGKIVIGLIVGILFFAWFYFCFLMVSTEIVAVISLLPLLITLFLCRRLVIGEFYEVIGRGIDHLQTNKRRIDWIVSIIAYISMVLCFLFVVYSYEYVGPGKPLRESVNIAGLQSAIEIIFQPIARVEEDYDIIFESDADLQVNVDYSITYPEDIMCGDSRGTISPYRVIHIRCKISDKFQEYSLGLPIIINFILRGGDDELPDIRSVKLSEKVRLYRYIPGSFVSVKNWRNILTNHGNGDVSAVGALFFMLATIQLITIFIISMYLKDIKIIKNNPVDLPVHHTPQSTYQLQSVNAQIPEDWRNKMTICSKR